MNFKHLHYFWTVARSGSVIRASERLHLTPQTISAQIKLLEQSLDATLFRPVGRGLELTEAGRLALSYADEIFALGDELQAALASLPAAQRTALQAAADRVRSYHGRQLDSSSRRCLDTAGRLTGTLAAISPTAARSISTGPSGVPAG